MQDPIIDLRTALAQRLPDADPDLALLIVLATRVTRILEWDLQRANPGLEASEYSVLATLWLAGADRPLSQTELSQLVVQTTSGMTKTLRRLEQRRLVRRIPDPGDRRRRLVRLTPSAARLVERNMMTTMERWQDRLDRHGHTSRARLARSLWSFVALVEESFLDRNALGPPTRQRARVPGTHVEPQREGR